MVLGNSILMKGGCLITDYCVLLQDNTSVEPAEAKTRWYMKTYYVVSCHPMFMHRCGVYPTFMYITVFFRFDAARLLERVQKKDTDVNFRIL